MKFGYVEMMNFMGEAGFMWGRIRITVLNLFEIHITLPGGYVR